MNNNTLLKSKALYIGVLSGTSLDAVDVALVDFSDTPTLIATHQHPMPKEISQACLAITASGTCTIPALGELDHDLGQLFAKAVLSLLKIENISCESIQAIGSHGQTLWHQPEGNKPFTLQLGNANLIAEQTGISTVADFRRRDMAAGGQGAPLASALHQALFSAKHQRFIVNIGGISNLTVLSPGKKVIGYDSGPGNGLLDQCTQKYWGQAYDQGGQLASQGTVNQPLLDCLRAHPYFALPHPKSTGREVFHLDWVLQQMQSLKLGVEPTDLLATLMALTVETISCELERHAKGYFDIYVCGGGVHNKSLMDQLSQRLQTKVLSTDHLGLSPDWVESVLFAWLARQTMHGLPGNEPTVTGANNATVLGTIYPGHSFKERIQSVNRERTATTASGVGIGVANDETRTL